MKAATVLAAVHLAISSFGVEVSALPSSAFADTEASTNFTFAVGEGLNRRLVFSLELQASPTNNVEVAIGCDADGDGRLRATTNPANGALPCGNMRRSRRDMA